ncbi:MAG: hypothetical protein IT367_14665, partial [Candidatus Hydrogenedentes bacterium]|nr:hypothetical protein [Candidatus Hydrogenedentota bacterium]
MNRLFFGALACVFGAAIAPHTVAENLLLDSPQQTQLSLGQAVTLSAPGIENDATYAFDAGLLASGLSADERINVEVKLSKDKTVQKDLHAGDPSFYLPFRSNGEQSGAATITIKRNDQGAARPLDIRAQLVKLGGPEAETAFEAEPNDSPATANRFEIGRLLEGSADDVDYFDNVDEGKNGLDWFRIDIADEKPVLVMFELDIPDRDVSVNMRCYTLDPSDPSKAVPYLEGKDPMEIVHDRERER